jgi:3-hydroxybutyryl-CoA dehydrogenase
LPATSAQGKVAIIGAGLMGAEIGAEYAAAGFEVVLQCRSKERAAGSERRAHTALDNLSDVGIISAGQTGSVAARISSSTSVSGACQGAAIVVESVVEDFPAKVEVLTEIASASEDAIVASNTSSLSISQLADSSGLGARLLGTHYWNPPTLMPLVEVVAGLATDPAITEEISATLRSMGKEPVLVPDIPGFVWNRLQFALLHEALSLVQHYSVAPETIDIILKKGLGRRWSLLGPFETAALGGVHTFATVAAGLFPELEKSTVDPNTLLALHQPAAERRSWLMARRNAWLRLLLLADRQESGEHQHPHEA